MFDRSMKSVFMAGLGHHHPATRITNRSLVDQLETSEAWIVERTGIDERRRIGRGETASQLGTAATLSALERVGWSASDLQLLVCATSSPDTFLPATASHMARKLGCQPLAFDINAACAGAAYGIAVGRSMMQTMNLSRAAVCCVDTYTEFTDYRDRRTAVLFGDGAATALLQTDRPTLGAEILDVDLENDHRHIDLVQVPRAGGWQLRGREVVPPALSMLAASAERILARNQLAIADLRGFVGHQANYRILETLAERLGVRPEQHWSNVHRFGNQGAAGALATLSQSVMAPEGGPLRSGELILMTVVGAGFTAGSVLLRWIAE
ncbi:MAG: ketoacyl-ACP synthase III [Myxococcales bacterium]|nr:ketoacyl-ACP synthase III [Myxococcales bacterium]